MTENHQGYTDDEWDRLLVLFDDLPGDFYGGVGPEFWEDAVLNVAQIIEDKRERQQRICCNIECEWIGSESDCVHPKHVPDERLCPRCNEVTEVYNE